MGPLNLNDPVIRLVAWVVAIAVAIRVTVELIWPVLPYLAGLIVLIGTVRIISWWRGRW